MTVLANVDHVTRRFGAVVAVDDVSLDIESGSIVGLLGPNGAGKTTLITLLQGLRRPGSGRVELFGGSPSDYRRRQRLGSTPQETALPTRDSDRLIVELARSGIPFADLAVRGATLEEAFLALTGAAGPADGSAPAQAQAQAPTEAAE